MISCIILWGITNILYKKSSDYNDPLPHCKTFVWIGIVMAPAGCIMALCSDTVLDSIKLLGSNLYLIPLSVLYAVALFFGLLGKKHLDASVVSLLENIDGAMAAIILYCFYLVYRPKSCHRQYWCCGTNRYNIDRCRCCSCCIQEHKLSNQEIDLEEDKKRYRLGALALIFPLLYNLVDAVLMVVVGITVSGETEVADFFFFECFIFLIIAILTWLYMLIVKKYKYNPFKKEELTRCGAATGGTFKTMAYIFAVGSNPIFTAPVSSSYCLSCDNSIGTYILKRTFDKKTVSKFDFLSDRYCFSWHF